MSSSIFSSEPWGRFCRTFLFWAVGMVGSLYGSVVLVDPWGMLPLSLPLPRVPVSSNARFSFPALARSERFDSVIVGTSTARLLRPAQLDPAFGARFANLAMNSATAWEQTQLLGVFLRTHPRPVAVLIDIDAAWCGAVAERLTPRPFPAWMYGENLWRGYRDMLTPYAVQEAVNQAAILLHLKRRRYGMDGYTQFVPPESQYDPARVDAAFARWPGMDRAQVSEHEAVPLPALESLRPALQSVPKGTRVVLFFPPIHIDQQGAEGSGTALRWAACKREVVRIAREADGERTEVMDFMFPNAVTQARSSYWDPLHYREGVAARVAALLSGADGPEVRRIR